MKDRMVNQEIVVTGYYFGGGNNSLYPSRFTLNNKDFALQKSAIKCSIRGGSKVVDIFSTTDGIFSYKIEHDRKTSSWKLVSRSAIR